MKNFVWIVLCNENLISIFSSYEEAEKAVNNYSQYKKKGEFRITKEKVRDKFEG